MNEKDMKKHAAEIKISLSESGSLLGASTWPASHLPPLSSPEAALSCSCHRRLEHLWLHQAPAQDGAICGSSHQKWGADGLEQGKVVAKKFSSRSRRSDEWKPELRRRLYRVERLWES